jgi:hypothetical protein
MGLLDLSETGARLAVREALARGQEIEVTLQAQGQSQPIRLLAEVIWCSPESCGGWHVGVRFQKSLPWKDLTHLA